MMMSLSTEKQEAHFFLTRHLMTHRASCKDRSASSSTSLLEPRTIILTVLAFVIVPVNYQIQCAILYILNLNEYTV